MSKETLGVTALNPRNGRQVPRRRKIRFQEAAKVCQRLGTMILLAATLCGRAEAELFDLVRLSSLVNTTPGEVSLVNPLTFKEKPHERRRSFKMGNDLAASSAKQPPVYLSAPKQISSTKEIHQHHHHHHHHQQPELHHQRQAIEHVKAKEASGPDLHVAADHYTKKSSKRKHKKPKKQVKKKEVVRKKYKKVVVVVKPYKYEKPSYGQHHHHQQHHHHHQPQVAGGKFYEYREVPKKGAWKFGYKRGNAKHLIERKEDGHKSHFKSVVKWMADKGKGHHLFDYNHGDHHGEKGKQHHYHAAAAKVSAAVATPHQHQHQHQHQQQQQQQQKPSRRSF